MRGEGLGRASPLRIQMLWLFTSSLCLALFEAPSLSFPSLVSPIIMADVSTPETTLESLKTDLAQFTIPWLKAELAKYGRTSNLPQLKAELVELLAVTCMEQGKMPVSDVTEDELDEQIAELEMREAAARRAVKLRTIASLTTQVEELESATFPVGPAASEIADTPSGPAASTHLLSILAGLASTVAELQLGTKKGTSRERDSEGEDDESDDSDSTSGGKRRGQKKASGSASIQQQQRRIAAFISDYTDATKFGASVSVRGLAASYRGGGLETMTATGGLIREVQIDYAKKNRPARREVVVRAGSPGSTKPLTRAALSAGQDFTVVLPRNRLELAKFFAEQRRSLLAEDGPDAAAKALALGKAEEALVVRFGQSAGPGGLRTSGVSGQYSDTCVEMAAFYTLWNNAMLVGRFDELLTKAADTFGQANVLFVRQNGNTVPVSIKMGDVWVIMGLQCPTTNCAHALGCLQYCPASTCLRLPPGMKAPPGAKEDSKDTIVDADWETFCRTDPGKSLKGAPKFAAFKDKYKREPTKVSTGHRKQPGATSVPVDMLEYEACLAKAQGSISPPPSLVTTG